MMRCCAFRPHEENTMSKTITFKTHPFGDGRNGGNEGPEEKFSVNNFPENAAEADKQWGAETTFQFAIGGSSIPVKARSRYKSLRVGSERTPGISAALAAKSMLDWVPTIARVAMSDEDKLFNTMSTMDPAVVAAIVARYETAGENKKAA